MNDKPKSSSRRPSSPGSTRCESRTKAMSIAPRAPRCSPRRSNCAVISSASRPSAGHCRRAVRSIGDYRFQGEDGPTDFAGLFGDKQTLAIYCYMFGPERAHPCPMCTNTLGAWEGNAADIGQRISLAVVARSPIERLIAWKKERGWRDLRLYSDLNGAYSRDYFGILPNGSEDPGLQRVHPPRRDDPPFLVGRDGQDVTADPGQDPRGRARSRALVDGVGLDAGRSRRGLVS